MRVLVPARKLVEPMPVRRRAKGNYLKPERVKKIVQWLKRGHSARAVAFALDTSESTVLRDREMLDHGIDPVAFVQPVASQLKDRAIRVTGVKLLASTIERYDDIAEQMGVPRVHLIAMVLETVARDNLFETILPDLRRKLT